MLFISVCLTCADITLLLPPPPPTFPQHGHEALPALRGHLPAQLRSEQVWGARGEPLEDLPHVQRAVSPGLRPEGVRGSRAHSLRRPPAQLWLEKCAPTSGRRWTQCLRALLCMRCCKDLLFRTLPTSALLLSNKRDLTFWQFISAHSRASQSVGQSKCSFWEADFHSFGFEDKTVFDLTNFTLIWALADPQACRI